MVLLRRPRRRRPARVGDAVGARTHRRRLGKELTAAVTADRHCGGSGTPGGWCISGARRGRRRTQIHQRTGDGCPQRSCRARPTLPSKIVNDRNNLSRPQFGRTGTSVLHTVVSRKSPAIEPHPERGLSTPLESHRLSWHDLCVIRVLYLSEIESVVRCRKKSLARS